MAEPALKIATDYVRVAVANFAIDRTPAVGEALAELGLDLTDIHNALSECEVIGNKVDAGGALFLVCGTTTEEDQLEILVWVDADTCCYRVERVSRAPGDGR